MVYTLMCWNSWNYFRVNTPKEKHSNAEVHTKPWNHDNDDAFETFLGVFSFFVTLAMLFCLRVRSDVGKSEYNKWSYFGDHISTQFGPIRSGQTIIKMPQITCASWLNYNLLMRISNPTINNHSHVIAISVAKLAITSWAIRNNCANMFLNKRTMTTAPRLHCSDRFKFAMNYWFTSRAATPINQ